MENTVKKNNFTGLSAIIPGQADPGTLPPQPAPAPAAPAKPATKASAPAVPEKLTAAAQPRWKQSSVDADILDPFITLHSPAAPQKSLLNPSVRRPAKHSWTWNRISVRQKCRQAGTTWRPGTHSLPFR